MHVFLMRHGSAARSGPHADADRPLTPEGEAEVEDAAHGLARLEVRPKIVLTSPARRCRATAEIVARELGVQDGALRVVDALAAGTPPARLLQQLATIGAVDGLLLVGHEPDLMALASILVAGAAPVSLRFQCGGCACFEIDGLPPAGPAVLHWLLTPAQLRCVGRED